MSGIANKSRLGESPMKKSTHPTQPVRRAIRMYCLWCCNEQKNEVTLCPVKDCSLYRFRRGPTSGKDGPGLRPLKAIRARCLLCKERPIDVPVCKHEKDCPIWLYRNGHRPKGDPR